MSNHDDQLDGFFDALGRGSVSQAPGLDAQTAETARRLVQRATRIAPSQEYVNRLESRLACTSALTAVKTTPKRTNIRNDVRSRQTWFGRSFGALAVAAIAIVVMTVIYQSGPNEPIFAVASVAASPASFPAAADCNRDPVPDAAGRAALSSTYGPALLTTIAKVWLPDPNAPSTSIATISVSKLPAGAEPSAAVRAEVEIAVRREYACRNFGLFGWQTVSAGTIGNSTPQSGTPATPTAETGDVTPLPMPTDLMMTQLAEGRVGVVLPTDLEGAGFGAYAIYAPYQSDWFMTEYVRITPNS